MSQNTTLHQYETVALVWLVGLAACGGGGGSVAPQHDCDGGRCGRVDAGSSTTMGSTATHEPDAARADASTWTGGGELEARLVTSGHQLPCGACYVVSAQAQGGQPPYSYTWSDPTLAGPGPHQVCPAQAVDVTVDVRDSTPNLTGEFASATQVSMDAVHLDCVADAGLDGEWAGCMNPSPPGDAGLPIKCEGENSPDAGVVTDQGFSNVFSQWSWLVEPMVAGKTYTYDYDQLLPFAIGQSILVDIYGVMSSAPCEPLTKLFTLTIDTTWHQSYCFTADRPYDATLAVVHVNGIWFNFDLGTVGTLCKGCSQ